MSHSLLPLKRSDCGGDINCFAFAHCLPCAADIERVAVGLNSGALSRGLILFSKGSGKRNLIAS